MGGRKSKATVNARYRKMLAIEARRRARETAKQGPLPAKGVKKMIREDYSANRMVQSIASSAQKGKSPTVDPQHSSEEAIRTDFSVPSRHMLLGG